MQHLKKEVYVTERRIAISNGTYQEWKTDISGQLDPNYFQVKRFEENSADAYLSEALNNLIFSDKKLFPPLVKPSLMIVPKKDMNFTNVHVKFTICLLNLPRTTETDWNLLKRIETTCRSPGGKMLNCTVNRRWYDPSLFLGTATVGGIFMATDEVGAYTVDVRLCLPMDENRFGFCGNRVMSDSAEFLVTRNYFKDARQDVGPISYELEVNYDENTSNESVTGSPPEQKKTQNGKQNPTVYASKAWGLSSDKLTEKLFYSDRGSHKIFCVDAPTGSRHFSIDHGRWANDKLDKPTGIAVDEYHRRIIVTDKDNHKVRVFSMDGEHLFCFGRMGHDDGNFYYPWDVAVNNNGSLIAVTDSRNHRIQLFDRFGNFLEKYSIFESDPHNYKSHFDYPRGITFNIDGTALYFTDFNQHNVLRVPIPMTSYTKLTSVSGNNLLLKRPQGITTDKLDGILVCDSRNDCIKHVGLEGLVASALKEVGRGTFLQYPVNICMLSGNKVAVLDGCGKVHIF